MYFISVVQVLVYVSSAYVSTMWQNVDEKVYPAPTDANSVLKLVDTLDIATLNKKTPEILKGHGNPYTLTKHLAEHEVMNAGFPATIVRPSMSKFMLAFIQQICFIYIYILYIAFVFFVLLLVLS